VKSLPTLAWPDVAERRRPVVDRLVENLSLDPSVLERAQLLAARSRKPVEQVLNQMGVVPDAELASAYAAACGCEVWAPGLEPAAALDVGAPQQYFVDRRVLPLHVAEDRLTVAICDPFDDETLAGLAFATGLTIELRVASPSDFRRAASEVFMVEPASPAANDERIELEAQRVADVGADSEAARLLTSVLETAVDRQASDIHIEPRRHDLRIRLRIDGRLLEHRTAPIDLGAAVTSRVKVLANLDLGERRLPQDGRATFVVEGQSVEARVSIVPTAFGESVVLRILDRVGLAFDLEALGISAPEIALLNRAMRAHHGIFFVSGPTGSGKTTTLYALLNGLASSEKKVLSVEDPVEHHFPHVNQVQVAPQIGLTFASALRSFLRQDPDVILVGEVRDRETATIAVQAAMTGHLVLASVHANDAIRVVPRLLDMGIEPYQLAAALLGSAAQRLVRKLCPTCRRPRALTEAERIFVAVAGAPEGENVWDAVGCDACAGSGYRGRVALLEGFICHEEFSAAVAHAEPLERLSRLAVAGGLRSINVDGVEKAFAGMTTLAEVMAIGEA
jgi:type II secretory ATPase GspE/PulE/Tfp pilus assembly ATPase PilB-like protein